MKRISVLALSVYVFVIAAGCMQEDRAKTEEAAVSGTIVGGYRVLSIPENSRNIDLAVYRGDYLRFAYDGAES